MRTARSALLGVLAGVAAAVGAAAPAGAQTEGREITRYSADVEVGRDGVADVRVELDFDFGDEPGHGPFLTLPTRQAIEGDDEQDRLYRITDVTAASETAPDDLDVEDTNEGLILRIGDEDVDDVAGVHTYVVEYRVDGWINPASTTGAGDELVLDVLGPAWEIPLSDISATVTGPADVTEVACFAGPRGSTTPCTDASQPSGPTATFRQDRVGPGEPFTVVAAWPAGTFPGVEPILGDKVSPWDPFTPTVPTGALALLVAGVGSAVAVRRVRSKGRDRSAIGLPPGMVAGADRLAGTFRDHRPPVAVKSAPPAGVLPGELGTLLDEVADPRDVTATIVDLAVRGYLQVREVPAEDPGDAPEDWELVAVDRAAAPGAAGADAGDRLTAFEERLLADIFKGRTSVRMSALRTTFSGSMGAVQQLLYQHVTERGWFTANPRTVRTRWYLTGTLLLVAGIVLGVIAGVGPVVGLGLVAVALGLVGILVLVLAHAAPARTAAGTAVLAEAAAFKRYLETADADRLRAVIGEDLFSRYLPYAIAFGLTERWTGVFGDLAAQGHRVPEPSWYSASGPAPYLYWGATTGGFADSVQSFESITTESISAATPASSGSSGTSGGYSGGGVGGGGGGGW